MQINGTKTLCSRYSGGDWHERGLAIRGDEAVCPAEGRPGRTPADVRRGWIPTGAVSVPESPFQVQEGFPESAGVIKRG